MARPHEGFDDWPDVELVDNRKPAEAEDVPGPRIQTKKGAGLISVTGAELLGIYPVRDHGHVQLQGKWHTKPFSQVSGKGQHDAEPGFTCAIEQVVIAQRCVHVQQHRCLGIGVADRIDHRKNPEIGPSRLPQGRETGDLRGERRRKHQVVIMGNNLLVEVKHLVNRHSDRPQPRDIRDHPLVSTLVCEQRRKKMHFIVKSGLNERPEHVPATKHGPPEIALLDRPNHHRQDRKAAGQASGHVLILGGAISRMVVQDVGQACEHQSMLVAHQDTGSGARHVPYPASLRSFGATMDCGDPKEACHPRKAKAWIGSRDGSVLRSWRLSSSQSS